MGTSSEQVRKRMRNAKNKGYRNEVKVQKLLELIFPAIKRTGNFSQRVAGAPDLEQKGGDKFPIRLVATVQDSREPIISMRVSDLARLFDLPHLRQLGHIVVQVKARKDKVWVEKLMEELEEATK